MEKEKISNAEIGALGVTDLPLLVNFSRVANGLLKHQVMDKGQILADLGALVDNPEPYVSRHFGKYRNLAEEVIRLRKEGKFQRAAHPENALKAAIADFPVYGIDNIEAGALAQMTTATKLPISVAGALMPDAHQGYGLPIGGVLATTADTIIPYAVGVDIACRMCMSIFELPAETVDTNSTLLRDLLLKHLPVLIPAS